MDIAAGSVLGGKYVVDRVLGQGGMGTVLAAYHQHLHAWVAIKVLSAAAAESGEARVRFEREARAGFKLQSEYVAKVYDIGYLDSGVPFLVMEYLEGEDLAAKLATHGPFTVAQAVGFVLQASVALAEAHGTGLVHRDVKPSNLFCVRRRDGEEQVKVLDFGISKLVSAQQLGPTSSISLTQTAVAIGSPPYMSPEQLRESKDVDLRTDIWALGVVLFELTTGQLPFFGRSLAELAIKINSDPSPSASALRPNVSPLFDVVVQRCLSKDRETRYANLVELARALAPFADRADIALISRIEKTYGETDRAAQQWMDATTSAEPPKEPGRSSPLDTATFNPVSGEGAWTRSKRTFFARSVVLVGAALALAGVFALTSGTMHSEPTRSSAAVPIIDSAPQVLSEPAPSSRAETSDAATGESSTALAPPAPSHEHGPPADLTPPTPSSPPKTRPSAAQSAKSGESTRSPPVRPTKPNCNPRYTIDAQGYKHFKPHCIL